MKKAFLFCGLTGWCMEVLWTGLHSVLSGELTMTGKTSLLMFPIYGCADHHPPTFRKIFHISFFCAWLHLLSRDFLCRIHQWLILTSFPYVSMELF